MNTSQWIALALAATSFFGLSVARAADDVKDSPLPAAITADAHISRRLVVPPNVLPDRDQWRNTWPVALSVWRFNEQGGRVHAGLSFNQDATVIRIVFPDGPADAESPPPAWFIDTGESTTQYDDGTWIFSAKDAAIEGEKAKLETHPGNHRVGFWTNANDALSWTMAATRWGMYEVELVYSLAGDKKNDIAISIGDKQVSATIAPTGSWYDYRSITCGRVYLENAGERTIGVACTELRGGAVMNLKAVILRPSHEGERAVISQAAGEDIILHSSNATVLGKTLRYEPNPKKITLGYWANPKDAARFRFKPVEAGEYDVEVLQGCGQGQGGSDVSLQFNDGHGVQTVNFTVEDTGHFQNFKPRIIGRITITEERVAADSVFTLDVRPITKAKGAVMDLRQVRLVRIQE